MYLWNGCVPMEWVCTYGRSVKVNVPMERVEWVCTYGRGVYLWKGCVPMELMCIYGRSITVSIVVVQSFCLIHYLPRAKSGDIKVPMCL